MSCARSDSATVRLKVPFHDCDPLFVVWHGHYFKYFELARTALFAQLELDVEHVRAMGYRMYVTETRCRHMAPLAYNDAFEVTARLVEVSPLLRVVYNVRNLTTGRRVARALTALATTDSAGALLKETPDDVLSRLPAPAHAPDR